MNKREERIIMRTGSREKEVNKRDPRCGIRGNETSCLVTLFLSFY
jgi:hypothetical protein